MMNMTETLEALGVDVAATLNRFSNNAPLLEKFVRKYPQDGTFQQIIAAMNERDHRGLENAAHTLKGLAANMGFAKLSKECDVIVKALRGGEQDLDILQTMIDNVTAEHQKIIAAIDKMD